MAVYTPTTIKCYTTEVTIIDTYNTKMLPNLLNPNKIGINFINELFMIFSDLCADVSNSFY